MRKLLFILSILFISLSGCKNTDPHAELKHWNKIRTSNYSFSDLFEFAYTHVKVDFFDSVEAELNKGLILKDEFHILISDSCDIKTNELRVQYSVISPQQSPKRKHLITLNVTDNGVAYNGREEELGSYLQKSFQSVPLSETSVFITVNKTNSPNWSMLFSVLQKVYSEIHKTREEHSIRIHNQAFKELEYGEKCLIAGKEALHVEIIFKR